MSSEIDESKRRRYFRLDARVKLEMKKNGNHIKTADSKENSDKAVDVKGIEKKLVRYR